MSKFIEDAKKLSDAINGGKSKISGDLKEILKEAAVGGSGMIIEIPWGIEFNGEFAEAITVVVTKVTKDRIYFINPIKVSSVPCEIKEGDKKGPPRTIEEDGQESMSIMEILKLSKTGKVLGILPQK